AGRGTEADAQFTRDDLRQGGLAQARRADEQHMVKRSAALPGSLDEDFQISPRRGLPDKFGKTGRAQRDVERIVTAGSGRSKVGHARAYSISATGTQTDRTAF